MRKWLAALVAVVLVGALDLWPFPQTDTGELYIVETLTVDTSEGVTLQGEDIRAWGGDMEGALAALEARTPGKLFLGQTQRVILLGETTLDQENFRWLEQLPAGARLYHWAGEELDLEQLAPVLRSWEGQHTGPTLADGENRLLLGQEMELEELHEEE